MASPTGTTRLTVPQEYVERLSIRNGELHILCPAGMGDFAWIWSKWWKVAAERDVTFWFPKNEQRRAWALAEIYGAKWDHLPTLTTDWVWQTPGDPPIPDSGDRLAVHANKHLENGLRLEKWYPDLPLRTPTPNIEFRGYHHAAGQSPYVIVFPCQHGYMEKGGNLLPGQWARLCREIEDNIAPVVLVGAGKDVELIEDICELFCPILQPLKDEPLTMVLSAIKGAKGMIGAASGLTILSTYMGVPTVSAYPRWLVRMPRMWEQEGARCASPFLDELTDGTAVDILAGLVVEARL